MLLPGLKGNLSESELIGSDKGYAIVSGSMEKRSL